MTTNRPPITCHVLDTVAGKPASSIPVTLTLIRPYGPSKPLHGKTNADGRVSEWTGDAQPSLEELFQMVHDGEGGVLLWALKFDVGAYFKGEGFWEEVEIRFKTDVDELGAEGVRRSHWHVPLLLSPWSYTTYRGS